MQEKLLEVRGVLSEESKKRQQDEIASMILRMLVFEGFKKGQAKNEEDMFDMINHLDIETFLNIKEGEHIACVRPGCDYHSHANFFKGKDDGSWLYRCPCCKAGRETIKLSELLLEIIQSRFEKSNRMLAIHRIKKAMNADYTSEYYREVESRLEYNKEKLENVEEGTYLKKLIRKRKLDEFYKMFSDITLAYTIEDNDYNYSFYASRQTVLDYIFDETGVKQSNSTVEKINLLAELGFISKLQPDLVPSKLREKVRYRKDDKATIKDVSVYQVNRITEEQLIKAEEYAKAVINNKIYRNKVSLEKSIEETCSFTRDEEKFLDRANKAIVDELNEKGYIALSSVVSKIDKKAKYYNKEEKEKFFNLLEDRILLEANVRKIKATKSNKEKYSMKRVKDKEVILVKSEEVIEIADRIRVKDSVRVYKAKKKESIKAKKEKLNATVVKTYMENGCKMAVMSDGSVDMIDIPF